MRIRGAQRGNSRPPRRVVLHLLEYPIEANHEIGAVHNQPHAHQTDERELLVAQRFPRPARAIDALGGEVVGARERRVPRDGGDGGAGYDGGEEVVEGECERGGPGADKYDLYERVGELARGAPEAEGAAEVFYL